MYVNNEVIPPHEDPSDGFYAPEESNPPDGACGDFGKYNSLGFTLTDGDMDAHYGITLCPNAFTLPTTSSLNPPTASGGTAEIDKFKDTGGILILHEFVHLVTLNGEKHLSILPKGPPCTKYICTDVKDQPAAYPPDGTTWTNRDWASWVLSSTGWSYGYTPAAYLGLSMPKLAMLNADNYAILGMCMQYPSLDCLGTFQNDIVSKRKLPFQVSSRTVQKIRAGELDLKRDDVPTDMSDDFASLYQDEVGGSGSLDSGHLIGQTGKHPSRFSDV